VELSAYVLERLHEDDEFILSRGHAGRADPRSLLLLAPVSTRPTLETLKKIDHEYSFREELDGAWAARPFALSRYGEQLVLVRDDPGGEPLSRLIHGPMELGQFLRIALGVAAALRELHRRQLIHKDLKPANILVDPASGHSWLTGFGIASRQPRERQAPGPAEFIAGTLPYMAPEQTGRMNRSIDSRSDLYALGVTLYEALTGSLPFGASEPMEWVHCHIATPPVSPAARSTHVPAAVDAIIMKLLAKTVEDRYQTAAGLEHDLSRCLADWDQARRITDFPLGEADRADWLVIPEGLYGRTREIQGLLAAFGRVATNGKPELVLVSGYSGIGKSSVVNELHKELVPHRGLFAFGKFDQYKRDVPYATLAQAFQALVRSLLGKSDTELAIWRDTLRDALGLNGRLIVDLVPELRLIIGEQAPAPELPLQQAQARFQLVVRRFVNVFARPEHPLVLFVDDLQWIDPGTLDVMEHLVTHSDVQHLLVIGAYRDNEVDANHPLVHRMNTIRQAGTPSQEISLVPLTRADVQQLLADTLRCELARTDSLAQLIHHKTAGNPFFLIQFLHALADEGLLTFDHAHAEWSWDVDRIRAKGYTDNVVDLMVGKLRRLPQDTQAALQQLACLGHTAETAMLSQLLETAEDQVHSAVWAAVRLDLVERTADGYQFVHDRVQEAAYSLIPKDSRPAAHLRIGRLLTTHTPRERREEAIFEIVNQLNRGAALIAAPEERESLAQLNLIAGQRASASAAYASALTYLVAGAELLPVDGWERLHDLAFALGLHRAACEYVTGELGPAEARLAALATLAGTPVERAAVAGLRIDLHFTLDQSDRAISIGLEYLRQVGIDWSPHPSAEDAKREYDRIWSQLGTRAIEDLIALPVLTDPTSLAILDILAKLATPAFVNEHNLQVLVSCRAVNLSLERGHAEASCNAYTFLAMIAGALFGNYQAGYRFGRLGCELAERHGWMRVQPRTDLPFGLAILPWTKPVRSCRDWLRRAFEVGTSVGDVVYASTSGPHINTNMLLAGDHLVDVEREAERGLAFAHKTRFGLAIEMIDTQLALVRTLRGLTRRFGSLDDDQFDEVQAERRFQQNPNLQVAECLYWVRKLQARVLAGDAAAALEASQQAERLLWTSASFLEHAEYQFYTALARALSCDPLSAEAREPHLAALATHQRQLDIWAHNCPDNFENRAALVEAEIARLEGRPLDAERLYEKSIQSAHAQGFIHNEAVACESAARFYAARGFAKIADAYLREARYGYFSWGADGKVRQLDQLYPHLKKEEPAHSSMSTIVAPVEFLDLATVIEVSQVVSGEMVLEKLIDRLMRAAVEHAGAERGLLIRPRGDALQLEAEARTDGNTVIVLLQDAPATSTTLPESLVRYVIRTEESVLLDDASVPNQFAADPYLVQHRARSVLCLPLMNQGKLTGALYLENNLTSRAFTPDRIAVLKVLASQAAIALENARLYRDLEQREAEIGSLKDQLYRENLALRDEVDRTSMFEEIVGSSEALKAVLSRVAKVAPTDSTVFITGETGTGKELIARAVHKRSDRSGRAFVSVNCAALAPTLISSELFGHEKGAFTGAVQRRLGRFELADGGTLFLDEVGELLPDTQVALLRVLQEREFERVGGAQPIHVDVRVIVATNRDLHTAVAQGSFRQDLFYRLNVFPIEVPPLRDRKDDLLMLVEYFVKRYASGVGKQFRSIEKNTLDLLRAYHWPGNIRELQNVIERSVILSAGEVFAVDELWLFKESAQLDASGPASAPFRREPASARGSGERRSEREQIEAALAETRGRVAGPSGAAAKLGVPLSTLDRRIKALNIDKRRFRFR